MVKIGVSTHQPTNSSTNTRKFAKLCVDVCGYGCGCVNANVAVSASAYVYENVADCVDVYEKIFCIY